MFAFLAAAGRPSIDRRLWLARAGDDLLVVGEPVTDEQERLVEKVLELNDELVSTHRELVRQRSAAEANADASGIWRRSPPPGSPASTSMPCSTTCWA